MSLTIGGTKFAIACLCIILMVARQSIWEATKMSVVINDLISEVRLDQIAGDCTDDQADEAIDTIWDMYIDRYNFNMND